MDAERWKKVKNILENALETAPESRSKFLDEACGTDKDLRNEVEKLLEFEQPDEDILEKNPVSAVLQNGNSAKSQIGRQIGNYKITSELGAGGMGAVFLAERADGEFSRKTALKLIKRGMDSDAVLHRFYNERQILASLEHPNIARLIDGGTTDNGLPFFVMEYVEGATILEYADAENLDLEARLKLFRKVCAVVSFAHQNLVIHRDLKPSNILVAKDGKVKLLDFGIAKLLKSDETNQTATQMHVFTPEYASPEQVRDEKLTTATDIYSLGVILYELLTGNRPYKTDSQNISEIIKSVCETKPVRPSSFVSRPLQIDKNLTSFNKGQRTNPKSLKGDLDNIILKSLRKEPERRYSSVEQFSEDIRRHLAGLPVSASADTWTYYTVKLIRRNRLTVGAAAIVLITLLSGMAATLRQNRIANRERMRAERRSENLRKVSNSLVGEIERAIRDLPGSLPARKLLLERAVEQLDALAAETEGNTDLQLELVWAYQNLGSLPDGKLSERRKILEKAFAIMEKIPASELSEIAVRDRLAMLHLDMLVITRNQGDLQKTIEHTEKAVKIIEKLRRDAPENPEIKDSVWTVSYHHTLTLQQLGKAAETVETARKILPIADYLHDENPPETDKYNFIKPQLTHLSLGYGLNYAGDFQGAISEFETALAQCLKESQTRPDDEILHRNEANIRIQFAYSLKEIGETEKASENIKKALEIRKKLSENNPTNYDYQLAFAESVYLFGIFQKGDPKISTEHFRQALDLSEKLIDLDSERFSPKILAARACAMLGKNLAATKKSAEGLELFREALNFYESNGAAKSADANLKRYYAETLMDFAETLMKTDSVQARENYRKSVEIWQDLQQNNILRSADNSRIAEIAKRTDQIEKAGL